MRTLDLVTRAGQGDVMNKMLRILRRESLRLESPIAAADLASLSNAMTELEHEAGRSPPTTGVFNRHVEEAIGAFSRTTEAAPAESRPVGGQAACDIGSVKQNVLPPPDSLSAQMRPPCPCTMHLEM